MSAGDITLTAAVTKSVPGFTLASFGIDLAAAAMTVGFTDALGAAHYVTLNDTACSGFGISGGVITDGIPRAVSGEYTKLLGILFGAATGTANQRRSAAINALVTDGIITVVGTVA